MRLAPQDCPDIIPEMKQLALTSGYTKIFAKVPRENMSVFQEAGYVTEAYIPGFFKGGQGAAFMALYLHEDRRRPTERSLLSKVLAISRSKGETPPKSCCPEEYQVSRMSVSDIHDMAGLYSRVFESYPFPIFDPDYLAETMENNVIYCGIRRGSQLIGLGSAETDTDSLNAEMTDFATLTEYRGKGMAGILLDRMTRETRRMGILTHYTIARAGSFGMNITFARAGYNFAGTLLNNTHIAGQLESMNVWYNSEAKESS